MFTKREVHEEALIGTANNYQFVAAISLLTKLKSLRRDDDNNKFTMVRASVEADCKRILGDVLPVSTTLEVLVTAEMVAYFSILSVMNVLEDYQGHESVEATNLRKLATFF